VLALTCYFGAFAFLALAVRTLPIGVGNALWSGSGILLVALVGYQLYGQTINRVALAGMLLIFVSTLIMNIGSRSIPG
jgi:small multidrug resistance pump